MKDEMTGRKVTSSESKRLFHISNLLGELREMLEGKL